MEIFNNSFKISDRWSQVKNIGLSAQNTRIGRLASSLLTPARASAYEIKHAYIHFTTKSENIKVFVRLFRNAISWIYSFRPSRPAEPVDLFEGLESLSLEINTDELPEMSNPAALRNMSELGREEEGFNVSQNDIKTAAGRTQIENRDAFRSFLHALELMPGSHVSDSLIRELTDALDAEGAFLDDLDACHSRESRNEFLNHQATLLTQRVRDLNPGEKFLYFGEMSAKGQTFVPPFFGSFLKSHMGPHLYRLLFEEGDEAVLDELKGAVYGYINEEMPALGTATKSTGDIASKLIQSLKKTLPDSFFKRLAEESKKDILELAVGRSPDLQTINFLLSEPIRTGESLEAAADRLWEAMCEEGLDQLLEQRIEKLLLNLFKYGKTSVRDQVESSIFKMTKQLPKLALEVLSEAGLEISLDHFLIGIERVDERYKLSLYTRSLGTEIHKPYQFRGDKGCHLPLIFDEIDLEDLDEHFFKRIMTYRVWPQHGEDVAYPLNDLYLYLCHRFSMPKARDRESSYPDSHTTLDNIADWFRLYHYQKSGLSKDEFQHLHDFKIPYHVLTRFWPKVIQDPTLLNQAALREDIKALRNKIAQSALNGDHDRDSLKRIYATLWEVNETLEGYEKKAERIKQKATRVVPGEVREHLTALFQHMGVCESSVEKVKELAAAVMGDEFTPIINELIEEILPGIPPAPHTGTFSWQQIDIDKIAPSLDGLHHFRLSPLYAIKALSRLFDILYTVWSLLSKIQYLGWLLTTLVPYLKQSEIGARGIALLMVIFGPERVKSLLPASVFEVVSALFGLVEEVYSYIKWRVFVIFLKAASQVLIKEEQIHSLTEAAQSVTAQITHKEKLQFHLPSRLSPQEAQFGFNIAHNRIASGNEEPETLLAQVSEKLPKYVSVDGRDLTEQLGQWNADLEHDLLHNPRLSELVLHSYIRSLPLPNQPGGCVWDDLESPKDVLDQLHGLLNKQHKLAVSHEADSFQEFFERITTTYALYSIIHRLSYEFPEASMPSNILASGEALIPWMNDPLLVIHNPRTDRQFNAVCDYFDLDRHKSYTRQDTSVYLSNRFFDHRTLGRIGDPVIASDKLLFSSMLTSNDFDYAYSLSKKKVIQKRLAKRGLTEKHHILIRLNHIFVDAPKVNGRPLGDRILPYPFYLLRLAHYMANEIVGWEPSAAKKRFTQYLEATGFHMGHPAPPVSPTDGKERVEPETTWQWIVQKSSQIYNDWISPLLQAQALSPNLPLIPKAKCVSLHGRVDPIRGYDFCLYGLTGIRDLERYLALIKKPSRRTQSEIMIGKFSNDADPYPEFIRQLEMVNQDPSSAVVRAFSLFMDHKHRLASARFMVLFDLYINDRKSLNLQLQERGEIVEYFGSCIKQLLRYFEKREDWRSYLHLVKAGHELMLYCQSRHPDSSRYFPDFAALVRDTVCPFFREKDVKRRRYYSADDGLIVSYLFLVSMYSHLDPRDVAGAEKRQIMMDIARLGFARVPWDWEAGPFGSGDQGIKSIEAIYRWRGEIVSSIKDDPEFRRGLLDALLEDVFYEPLEGEWTGTYPVFEKKGIVFDLFKKPNNESFEEDVSKLIPGAGDEVVRVSDTLLYSKTSKARAVKDIRGRWIVYRVIGNKEYRLLRPHEFSSLRRDVEIEDKMWLSPEIENPHVLHYRNGQLYAKHQTSLRVWTRRREYQSAGSEFMAGGEFVKRFQLGRNAAGLSTLAWFQPLESISVTTKDGVFRGLEFNRLKLHFKISYGGEGERPLAYCEDSRLSGYYIAEEQSCENLLDLSHYLILENAQGEKRVLVPKLSQKELLPKFLIRESLKMPSSHLFDHILDGALSRFLSDYSDRFVIYSLDAEGKLTSRDAEPLAYLLLLSLAKGDGKEMLRVFSLIDEYGRLEPLPGDVIEALDMIITFLGMSSSPESSRIVLRYEVIRTRSSLIHHNKPYPSNSYDMVRWLVVQCKMSEYLMNVESGAEKYLSIQDELLIFEGIRSVSPDQLVRTLNKQVGRISALIPTSLFGKLGKTFKQISAQGLSLLPSLAMRKNDLQLLTFDDDFVKLLIERALLEAIYGKRNLPITSINIIPGNPLSLLLGLTAADNDKRGIVMKYVADLKRIRSDEIPKDSPIQHDRIEVPHSPISLEPNLLTPQYFERYFTHFYFMVMDERYDELLPWLMGKPLDHSRATAFKCLRTILKMRKANHKLFNSLVDPEFLCELHELVWRRSNLMAAVSEGHIHAEHEYLMEDLQEDFTRLKRKWMDRVDSEKFCGGKGFQDIILKFRSALEPYDACFGKGKEPADDWADQKSIRIHAGKAVAVLKDRNPKIRDHITMCTNEFLSDNMQYDGDAAIEEALTEDTLEPRLLIRFLVMVASGHLLCSVKSYLELLGCLNQLYDIYESQIDPEEALRLVLAEIVAICTKASPKNDVISIARNRIFIEAANKGGELGANFVVKHGLGLCTGYSYYRWMQFFADLGLKGTNLGYRVASGTAKAWAQSLDPRKQIDSRFALDTCTPLDARLAALMHSYDDKIDGIMANVADEFLEETETGDAPIEEVEPFVDGESLSVNAAFEELNQSLQEYYRRHQDRCYQYTIKPEKKAGEFLHSLQVLRDRVEERLKNEREEIKQFVNQRRSNQEEGETLQMRFEKMIKKSRPMAFHEIQRAFVQQNDQILMSRGHVRLTELPKLKEKLFLYHVLASRWSLLFQEMDKAQESFPDDLICRLGQKLKTKRVYSFADAPKHLIRGKLSFEYATGTLLRETQSRQMDALLTSEGKDQVVEMIMGSGKTFYGTRIAAYFEANGSQAVFNVWPAPVAKTNIRECTRDVGKIFSQTGQALSFSRMTNWTERKLWAIVQAIEGSIYRRGQINTTKESLQAFELCFLEHAIDPEKKYRGLEESDYWLKLERFRQALRLVANKGKGIIDEFHVAADNRKELNHPIGKAQTIQPRHAVIIEDVLYKLLKNQDIEDHLSIGSDKPSPMSQDEYKRNVLPLLSDEISRLKSLKIPEEEQDAFRRYIAGEEVEIPEIVRMSDARADFALVKGLLTVLIPNALERTIHVDYNPSKRGNGEFARPSDGNDNPLEESTIRSPYEAIVKTGLMLAHDGLTDEQIDKLIQYLRTRVEQRLASENKSGDYFYRKTPEAKFFKMLFKHYPRDFDLKSHSDEERQEIYQCLRKHAKAILTYMRVRLIDEILYYPYNLSSNSSNFISMFRSFYGDTGTPYNDGCYPGGTEVLYDLGTDGETFDVIQSKTDDVVILDREAPESVLDEMIDEFILKDENIRAVIDRGAAFNGLSSDKVAKRLLERSPDRIKGVAYYRDREKVILLRNADHPVPFDSAGIGAKERLSYFPQPQTYAADIPQAEGAIGIVTLGEDTTFMELAQAIWRMRGLKTNGQRILFVMTQRVCERISPDKDAPDTRDIVAFTMRNQANQLAENTFQADKQKMHNVVRKAILDKAMKLETIEGAVHLLREFEDLFIRRLDADPWNLFGGIDQMVPPEEVFAKINQNYEKRLSESDSLLDSEKERILIRLRGVRKMRYRRPLLQAVRRVIQKNGAVPTELMPLFVEEKFTDDEIFEDLRDRWIDLIDLHVTFENEEEKERSMQELTMIGQDCYPSLVHTYRVDGEIKADAFDDIGIKSRVEIDRSIENEIEEDIEMNLQVDKNEESDRIDEHPHNRVKPQVRFSWPSQLDISNLDWLIVTEAPASCHELGVEHFKSLVKRFKHQVPIFSLKDALTKAGSEAAKVVSDALSDDILATNNMCHLVSSIGAPIEPLGRYQVPLQEALVIQDASRLRVLLIDKEEARYWMGRLKNSREDKISGPPLAIVDVSTQAIMAEGYSKLTVELTEDERFQEIVTQIKFLRGDVHYSKLQKPYLSHLISRDLKTFKKYFREVHRYHKTQSYLGSQLEKIILKLEGAKVKIRV